MDERKSPYRASQHLTQSLRRFAKAKTLAECEQYLAVPVPPLAALLRWVRLRQLSDEPGPYLSRIRSLLALADLSSGGAAEVLAERAHVEDLWGTPARALEEFQAAEAKAIALLEDVWATMAELHADQDRVEEAKAVLARARRLLPDSYRLRVARGHVAGSARRKKPRPRSGTP